jgi:transcription elongation factor GreA-like protein
MENVGHEKGVDIVWTRLRLYDMKNMRSEYWHLGMSKGEWNEWSCGWSCKGVVSS